VAQSRAITALGKYKFFPLRASSEINHFFSFDPLCAQFSSAIKCIPAAAGAVNNFIGAINELNAERQTLGHFPTPMTKSVAKMPESAAVFLLTHPAPFALVYY
jgi:hypothetical protein